MEGTIIMRMNLRHIAALCIASLALSVSCGGARGAPTPPSKPEIQWDRKCKSMWVKGTCDKANEDQGKVIKVMKGKCPGGEVIGEGICWH
jgi:hypothetical protein